MQVLALCGALAPGLVAAAPWVGALPPGPLLAAPQPGAAQALAVQLEVVPPGAEQPGVAPPVAAPVVAAQPAGAQPVAAHADGPPAATEVAADAGPRPAQDERLEQMRGGSDAPWSDMKLSGTVANNSAVNVVTGSNIVTDSAFSNASGLPMVIQNSGANVLIQNATIVNVQIK